MKENNSPWLHQLDSTRPVDVIKGDIHTHVAVVGAGISGVMTAYFILKYTRYSVVIIEGSKIAHGATGHNAGQIVADFERELTDLVREYGLQMAADAERDIRSGWLLLEEIFAEAKLATPFSTFMGFNGYRSMPHLLEEIKANAIRKEAGLQTYPVYVAKDAPGTETIPPHYRDLYELVPQADVMSLLETRDHTYLGAIALRKGCINSAMLSVELVGYLLATYKDRFSIFEHSSVQLATLFNDHAELSIKTNKRDGTAETEHKVVSERVVLCTNGFERIRLANAAGDDIDVKFHQMVSGDIGYMAAYTEELKDPPTAIGYYDQDAASKGVQADSFNTGSYVYVTRRPYEHDKKAENLICIGGPEKPIGETQNYDRQAPFSKEMGEEIDRFVRKTLKPAEKKDLEYKFQWHGIMCYTPTRMRVVGCEPKNPVLMYNLGCNGVGILPSIHGGWRIGKILGGAKFPPSIFDPRQ